MTNSFCLTCCVCLCLSVCVSTFLSLCVLVCLSLFLFLSSYVFVCLCFSASVFVHVSAFLPICPTPRFIFVSVSSYLPVCLSVCLSLSVYVYQFLPLSLAVWVCVYVWVHTHMCMHRGQRSVSGLTHQVLPTLSLRQDLSLTQNSPIRLSWLINKSQGSTCLFFPGPGIPGKNHNTKPFFLMKHGFWRSNWGLHTFMNAFYQRKHLSRLPIPQLHNYKLFIFFVFVCVHVTICTNICVYA